MNFDSRNSFPVFTPWSTLDSNGTSIEVILIDKGVEKRLNPWFLNAFMDEQQQLFKFLQFVCVKAS